MKKIISFAVALTLLISLAAALGGCDLFGSEESDASTTEEASLSMTEPVESTDLITETETEVPTTVTTTSNTTTTTAAPKTTTDVNTTTAAQTSTTTTTTKATTTTEPTTVFTANPSSNLSNHVISPLNSGLYTMSVVITEDDKDKIMKYAYGDKKAYTFQIPSAGYYCRLITLDGKYYMIAKTNTKSIYCELTSDKYNGMVSLMNNCFNYNFSNLSLQSSAYEMYNSKFYTKEVYSRPDGKQTNLWFQSGDLKFVEEDAGSSSAAMVGVSIASGADSSMFTLPDGYTLTSYEDMATIQMAIEMFLGEA